jgi:neurotransmitter:Na+ symporter, NSS family
MDSHCNAAPSDRVFYRVDMVVTVVMLVLGTASALSFTPLEWQIAGEPVLDFIDRVAGGNLIIFSGVLGAALFCWFIPPQTIRTVLGTEARWWEWRIYLIGRYLPVLVLIWIMLFWGMNL